MSRYTIAGFNMPQLSIMTGGMLGTLGIAFFAATDYVTALFPLLFGVFIAGAGGISIARPSTNAVSMHFAFLMSSISVLLGLGTALTGSWVTTTSLIEQVMMSVIGAGHISAGYGAYLYGRPSSESEGQTCGTSASLDSNPEPVKISDIIGTPEERITPAAAFALVTD
ncbi:MAG: hypothetical protein VX557_00710 [Candidatus Thermoplasmatota archaeon]|nr:hypothetical protein [Candidatus Thermoplasmatota archaeon]|tara:strand:- start:1389 stop:1892 length:504 start_codon:yes stop_codon:yes gene_type:complete